jgi:hypothetical protein
LWVEEDFKGKAIFMSIGDAEILRGLADLNDPDFQGDVFFCSPPKVLGGTDEFS